MTKNTAQPARPGPGPGGPLHTRPHPALQGEGVSAVKLAFERELRWLARPQPDADYGIDLHAEVVEGSRPLGRLLAVQVKAGETYFREEVGDGWVFRDFDHLDYWTHHSLPVIVVLYDPVSRLCYWQSVDPTTVESTGKGWKLVIPKDHPLDRSAVGPLYKLATKGDPSASRLAILRADRELIDAAAEGNQVVIEVDEWINKSSGRGSVRIVLGGGGQERVYRSLDFFAPGWDYAELLPAMFPWAKLEIDEDTYDEADHDQWDLDTGAWDNEDGRYIVHSEDFDEWAAAHVEPGLRAYQDDGEVARWRLVASLGPIGEAFLDLEPFLVDGELPGEESA